MGNWKNNADFVRDKHLKKWWNFACGCTISLIFKIYFFEIPWEIVFGGVSGYNIYFANELILLKEYTNSMVTQTTEVSARLKHDYEVSNFECSFFFFVYLQA